MPGRRAGSSHRRQRERILADRTQRHGIGRHRFAFAVHREQSTPINRPQAIGQNRKLCDDILRVRLLTGVSRDRLEHFRVPPGSTEIKRIKRAPPGEMPPASADDTTCTWASGFERPASPDHPSLGTVEHGQPPASVRRIAGRSDSAGPPGRPPGRASRSSRSHVPRPMAGAVRAPVRRGYSVHVVPRIADSAIRRKVFAASAAFRFTAFRSVSRARAAMRDERRSFRIRLRLPRFASAPRARAREDGSTVAVDRMHGSRCGFRFGKSRCPSVCAFGGASSRGGLCGMCDPQNSTTSAVLVGAFVGTGRSPGARVP